MKDGVSVFQSGRSDKPWKVKSNGASKAAACFSTQAEAIERGRQMAKNRASDLTVFGKDGQIRDKWSYGNDPFPPRG